MFDRAEQVLDFPLARTCFEGPESSLAATDVCQPAILTCSAAIVRALEGISAMRAMAIRRLADAGCHDEAVEGAEDLRKLFRDCVDLGISEADLWAAYTRILRLSEELDLEEPA
jgi:hypothetical protein